MTADPCVFDDAALQDAIVALHHAAEAAAALKGTRLKSMAVVLSVPLGEGEISVASAVMGCNCPGCVKAMASTLRRQADQQAEVVH